MIQHALSVSWPQEKRPHEDRHVSFSTGEARACRQLSESNSSLSQLQPFTLSKVHVGVSAVRSSEALPIGEWGKAGLDRDHCSYSLLLQGVGTTLLLCSHGKVDSSL